MLPESTDYCRLIFLRHPELEPKYQNLAVGSGDAALGRRGQAQVLTWLDLLAEVEVSAIHCAAQPQCEEPARALAANKQVSVLADPLLNDQQMGDWQGKAWDELVKEEGEAVQRFFAEFGEVPAPGGESLGQAVNRMLEWWKGVAAESVGKSLVVIASGGLISGFATAMLGIRLSRCVSLNLPHAGIGVLDCFANGARITTWNPSGLADL